MKDDRYKTAEATVIAGVSVSLIFLMIELIILFTGLTIFSDPTNILCINFFNYLLLSNNVSFDGFFGYNLVYYRLMALFYHLVYMDSFWVIMNI